MFIISRLVFSMQTSVTDNWLLLIGLAQDMNGSGDQVPTYK